jgi:hypothetical protein
MTAFESLIGRRMVLDGVNAEGVADSVATREGQKFAKGR